MGKWNLQDRKAQDRILRSQVRAKASGSLRDAKGVTHTSPGQRPGFMSPKTILSAEGATHPSPATHPCGLFASTPTIPFVSTGPD
jgi:hypothetical protein